MAGGLLQAVTGGVSGLLTSVAGMGVAAMNGQAPATPETPKEDAPITPPEPAPQPAAPEPEKVQQANEAQMKHDTGAVTQSPEINALQQKRSVYDLTGADLLQSSGGPEAVKTSEKKQQELLQNTGLLNNLKELKYAQEKGEDYIEQVASEKLGLRMRDAVASGLIPHPVDEDGDPITDFEGDEAVAAAEKHLEQYLPKDTTAQEGKVPDSKTEPLAPVANTPSVKKDEQAIIHQNNEEEFKRKSGVPAPPAAAQKDPNAPNREQLRLQNVYADKIDRLAAATTDYDRRDAEQDIQTSFEQMGRHNAAREAGIDTSRGIDYDVHAGTINGKAVSPESVERHIKLLKEQAAKDPKSLLTDEIRERRYGEKPKTAAVTAKNEEELKRANGISSANVTPEQAAAQTAAPAAAASPETKDARLTPEAAAGAAVPSAEVGAADTLASALPEAKPPASSVSAVNRVQALSANMPVGPAAAAPGGGASAAGGGGSSGGSMTINGTLALSGLQEAILSAQGSRVMQTEGGAPVVIDPTMQQGTPSAPKTYA
jgi:hypothetical protein